MCFFCQVNIVMLHENDPARGGCEFGYFFTTTPRELIEAGLYMPIAVAMHPMPHRGVSLTLAAQAFGGVKTKAARSQPSSTAMGSYSQRPPPPRPPRTAAKAKLLP